MLLNSRYFLCGLALAATIAALPAANSIAASDDSRPAAAAFQINRGAKGDRLIQPETIAIKRSPVRTAPPAKPAPTEQTDKRQILDGCEPSFSPVTVPAMAHIAGRCVG